MSERAGLRAFGENDGDLAHLSGRHIAFIGYGNQGRAQALNLRDSGASDIAIGTLKDASWTEAEADGFPVSTAVEAATK
ncbi:MAG: ketol-acid reductoisomerase, partial [Chloroflexi bacterium]|nr:ketol-acid reductoisomerase [Chloroflexota bacterium]